MATAMILWLLGGQAPSTHHVRSIEPKIGALIDTGLVRSSTFRGLVETLDKSDVIVYVDLKLTRNALGGYFPHNVIVAGGVRYLHIALDLHGTDRHLVSLLAHELQHAVEVAADPHVRDSESADKLFERLAIQFGCGSSTCSETQAAKDIEAAVDVEFKAAQIAPNSAAKRSMEPGFLTEEPKERARLKPDATGRLLPSPAVHARRETS